MMRSSSLLGGLSALALLVAAPARAADFPLTLDLMRGDTGQYGRVHVEADGEGGLSFEVEIDPEVMGRRAVLRHLSFNLEHPVEGLQLTSDDPVRRPYFVRQARGGRADRGRGFDATVFFRGGFGWLGNARLQRATFTLLADEPLAVEGLLGMTLMRGRDEPVQMSLFTLFARLHRRIPFARVGGVVDPASLVDDVPVEGPPPVEPPPIPEGCELFEDLITGEQTLVCP